VGKLIRPGDYSTTLEVVPVLLRIQPVDATICWNRSTGVSKFRVFLGRSLSRLATALSFACEYTERSILLESVRHFLSDLVSGRMKKRRPYPKDVSDEERYFAAPYLTLMNKDAPQRRYELRDISSRSARVSASLDRQRGAGWIPPVCTRIPFTDEWLRLNNWVI
jgi:hypothetical protein